MSKHSHTTPQRFSRCEKRTRIRDKVSRTRSLSASWSRIAPIVGLVLVVVVICTFFALSNALAQANPPLSAAKQQLVQSQAQWHAKVDRYKAPKGTQSMGSCPVDLHSAPVIDRLSPLQMATMHNAYASFASVISPANKPYFIFGENSKFVVQALPLDPCKSASDPRQNSGQTFMEPTAQGNLYITAVQGDIVIYTSASGAIGTFNYVTGQFS